jgi:bacterioferritin-associated ferredoxin
MTAAPPRDGGVKICLCMSVTDREIAEAYGAGHRSLDAIRSATRACTRCFGCEADLTSFYNDVLVPGRYTLPRGGWAATATRLENIETRSITGMDHLAWFYGEEA